MPIDLQLGVTKRFENTPFRASATLVNLNHWDSGIKNHINLGAELLLGDNLWLGGGYISNLTRSQTTHHSMKLCSISWQELKGVEVTVAGAVAG